MEGDDAHCAMLSNIWEFQSTPSAWRETENMPDFVFITCISIHSLRMEGDDTGYADTGGITYFNPLPPHGGRLYPIVNDWENYGISIHSLRMEGDPRSYPPMPAQSISIHSLRMEGDDAGHTTFDAIRYFNPLPPHGGRLPCIHFPVGRYPFQSTPSAWRETKHYKAQTGDNKFQSTPSAWRETCRSLFRRAIQSEFQSTPSAWRETRLPCTFHPPASHFNPLPPHGGRLDLSCHPPSFKLFQSTPSAWRETTIIERS